MVLSVIGFDIEWKPNYVKGMPENKVACVQLSDQTSVIVVQISAMRAVPEVLVRLLQDTNIAKVGVGISGECFMITINGFLML